MNNPRCQPGGAATPLRPALKERNIYAIQMTVFVFYYTCNVAIKLIDMILLNRGQAILCSEYNVIKQLTIT